MSMPSRTIRVMVVEDHDLMREATIRFLASAHDIEVVGASGSVEDAVVELGRQTAHPEVVILDMKLPGVGGSEGIPLLRAASPELRVLVLTMLESDEARSVAREAGADGYLTKGCAPTELIDAVRTVAAGGSVGFAPVPEVGQGTP